MDTIEDPFIAAAEEARERLIHTRHRIPSWAQILREAGITHAGRSTAYYHLNPRVHRGTRPHRVPPDLVRRLAAVLAVDEGDENELIAAAAAAAGHTYVEIRHGHPDITRMVTRFYGDATVSQAERDEVTAHLLRTIDEELTRRATAATNDDAD